MQKRSERKKYIRVAVTIKTEQHDWIAKNTINLSRFLQKAIDNKMKRDKDG